jgi:hypothetical protein
MESLITSYGINYLPFHLTINSLDGLVAGSSALAAYLTQEGIDPGFKPNDLDIFVPGHLEHVRDTRGQIVAGQFVIKSLQTMKNFLSVYGFTENDKFGSIDELNDSYYSSLKNIQKVTSFTNKDGKEIQIIVISSYNIIDHISKDFDLSACISWWDANSNTFKTMDPVTTKRKEMYMMRVADTDELHAKNKARAEKYIARGFKLIERPCPFIDMRDPRDQLSNKKFNDIEVMDIFTLDEHSIRDYLQKSDWNIVLKSGEAYYAFNRKDLMDYMKKKTSNIGRIGQVCETPFNQCITVEGYHQLRYADYSIYELKNAYSVPTYGGRVKSLFHLSCYSIQEWIDGHEGGLISMPPEHLATAAPTVKRIIRRGEPLPPQRVVRNPNIPIPTNQIQEVSVEDIMAAHAHLLQPGNLAAFHAAILAGEANTQ